jgi:hypothetical protein
MTFGEQNTEATPTASSTTRSSAASTSSTPPRCTRSCRRAETQGSTERFIGSWLKKSGKRDEIVLASKIAGPNASMTWIRGGRAQPRCGQHPRRRRRPACSACRPTTSTSTSCTGRAATCRSSAPTSFDPKRNAASVPIEETLAALGELVKAGKIRHIGVSNESSVGRVRVHQAGRDEGPAAHRHHPEPVQPDGARVRDHLLDEDLLPRRGQPAGLQPARLRPADAPSTSTIRRRTGRLTIFPPTWSPRYLRPAVLAAVRNMRRWRVPTA